MQALAQLLHRRALGEPSDFREQKIRQRHAGHRGASLQRAVHGVRHIADLNHFRHALNMLTCESHVNRSAECKWTRLSQWRRPGRPSTSLVIRALVSTMTAANPLWGQTRIHGELAKLGIISKRTVSRLLGRRAAPPAI